MTTQEAIFHPCKTDEEIMGVEMSLCVR